MNVITMKLENQQLPVQISKLKSRNTFVEKKCKNNRRKSVPGCNDKDALVRSHGLGCKPGDNIDQNKVKSENPLDTISHKKIRSKKNSPKSPEKMLTKSDWMQERLQQFLSPQAKEKISSLLSEVRALSDVEKLFLYLQLPTGSCIEDVLKPKTQNPLGKKADEEGQIAMTWIQSHLEEDPDTSLPKQEVYDEYQSYCQMSEVDALCAADFGKVMKQIFPSVKPRRLGTRGNSRYCYSGLRKKLKLGKPMLPDIVKENEASECLDDSSKGETASAACHVLFEWAEKLLGEKFTSLTSLASHLLENMYVDNRSVAAFTVLLDAAPQLIEKEFSAPSEGVKKTEAQIHLQRKIQEKELIKEQKKKLQEQRANIASIYKMKGGGSKKKNYKSKKKKDKGCQNQYLKKDTESIVDFATVNTNSSEIVVKEEFSEVESISVAPVSSPLDLNILEMPLDKMPPTKVNSSYQVHSLESEIEDCVKKKNKILLPRSKTPVCLAPNLSSIIIVPSLPPLPEISKSNVQNANSLKYKRIQPKPLISDNFPTIIRSRAGSVGSSLVGKPKGKLSDGRRSSHAWLQSLCSSEGSGEDSPPKNSPSNTNVSLSVFSYKGNEKKVNQLSPKDESSDNLSSDMCITFESSTKQPNAEISFLGGDHLSSKNITELVLGTSQSNKAKDVSRLAADEVIAVKRHLEESAQMSGNKRVHLDYNQRNKFVVSEDLWVKNDIPISDFSSFVKQNLPAQEALKTEEVSVHEIEGDAALDDYFRGAHNNLSYNSVQAKAREIELDRRQESCTNKVKQLSQLRMLLEQNLPRGIVNLSAANSLKDTNNPVINSSTMTLSEKSDIGENKQLLCDLIGGARPIDSSILCSEEAISEVISNEKLARDISQMDSFERLLSFTGLNTQLGGSDTSEILSDTSLFLNSDKNSTNQIGIDIQSDLVNISENSECNMQLPSDVVTEADFMSYQKNAIHTARVSTYTQVPSVPQSPNTRRRAFNFLPISPRHTPIPEGVNSSSISSPIPNQLRNMMSVAVGPSQPPSNAGSPFVSPRSTPVSLCRSRHSSGQSTSRHTPFQNFDSGVSSVSTSPFISPQPTPVPVSRLRHNSSHGTSKTVTFCSIGNPQVIHTQSIINSMRSRHSSGPGGPFMTGNLYSPRSAPLSPLVNDNSFVFPAGNEVRSRNSSGSNTTPLSPVSEQTSPSSSCTSNLPDLSSVNDLTSSLSHSFLNDGAADLLINGNPSNFKQSRQRHASSSVLLNKQPYPLSGDIFSSEIQTLLKNGQVTSPNLVFGNRSQSVPLHQMLQNLDGYGLSNPSFDDPTGKSHPTTPVFNHMFSYPENAATDMSKSLAPTQMEWSGLEVAADMDRRGLATLLDPPLSDDLQTTLEDLRDCDTDFSKFAQELELSQNEDVPL